MNQLYCPNCGWKCEETKGLYLNIEGIKGDHCTKCWATWLSNYIPKMQPVQQEPITEETPNETI